MSPVTTDCKCLACIDLININLMLLSNVEFKGKIFLNFVPLSESPNFTICFAKKKNTLPKLQEFSVQLPNLPKNSKGTRFVRVFIALRIYDFCAVCLVLSNFHSIPFPHDTN